MAPLRKAGYKPGPILTTVIQNKHAQWPHVQSSAGLPPGPPPGSTRGCQRPPLAPVRSADCNRLARALQGNHTKEQACAGEAGNVRGDARADNLVLRWAWGGKRERRVHGEKLPEDPDERASVPVP